MIMMKGEICFKKERKVRLPVMKVNSSHNGLPSKHHLKLSFFFFLI